MTSSRPQTLRELSAAPARPTFGRDGVALLLIDFQREYSPEGRLPLVGLGAASAQAQSLVEVFDIQSRPVVHVHQKSALVTGVPFAHGESGALPLGTPVLLAHHHRIDKRLPSAFAGTELAQLLSASGIRQLVIAGAMTHHCVDSTAREAMHLGLEVVVVSDACATRALPGTREGHHSAEEVHANALAALADRHAFVAPTRQVLEWLQPA
jgi:nicotinamidase-related amidase